MIEEVKQEIRKRMSKDLVSLICLFILSYGIFLYFDVIAWLHEMSHGHAVIGIAELAPTIFVMSFGFAAFAYRRWQDTKQLSLYTEELSMTDPMTNLPNRRAVTRLLKQVSENNEYPVGIVLIDIQGLEEIRSTLGLSVAEHILIEMLYRFSSNLSDEQLIAYWQAGQFVVFCPNLNQGDINELCHKLKSITLDNDSLTTANLTFNCVAKSACSKVEVERIFEDLEDALI